MPRKPTAAEGHNPNTTDAQGREPIPFDEALHRMVNTPPKHKKGGKERLKMDGQLRDDKSPRSS